LKGPGQLLGPDAFGDVAGETRSDRIARDGWIVQGREGHNLRSGPRCQDALPHVDTVAIRQSEVEEHDIWIESRHSFDRIIARRLQPDDLHTQLRDSDLDRLGEQALIVNDQDANDSLRSVGSSKTNVAPDEVGLTEIDPP
jgi:hypothetical protein